MYGNYSVSTIKRFIDNVAKDCGDKYLIFCKHLDIPELKDNPEPQQKKKKKIVQTTIKEEEKICVSCETTSSKSWKTDAQGKSVCEKCSQIDLQNIDFSAMDWKSYFKFSIPKSLKTKQLEAIWNSGKGPKIMDYYFKNRDKKALSNIAMELKKMYHLTSAYPVVQSFIQGVLADVTKHRKIPDTTQDDEDIQNVDWDEYFSQDIPSTISKNPELLKIWKEGTGKKMLHHFAQNIDKETLGHILDELNARFKYPLNVIKQFIKAVINDLCKKNPSKQNGGGCDEKLSPKKRKVTEACLDKENTAPGMMFLLIRIIFL